MKFFMGVCHPRQRLDLMQQAGVEWVRCDVPFPFEDKVGNVSQKFRNFTEQVHTWNRAGFRVMGITPYPRGWNVDAGTSGSSHFLHVYEEACKFMAQEFGDIVQGWQISNELNLESFRHPLTEEQALAFAKQGGSGVRRGNTSALVGVNMAGFGKSALRMYSELYPNNDVEFDYIGTDGYFGSWEAGGPESWHEKLALLHEKTGKPIIIQEFGYASKGDVMTPEERTAGKSPHELKKWGHAWCDGHTPEVQAAYLEETYRIFIDTSTVLGAIWYCWSDHEKCWNCGAPDCPCETAWGLVDVNEVPKPAYYAFSHVAKSL